MKKLLSLSLALLAAAAMTVPTLAASHTVQRGDTMWKLAVQYQVGTSEIIDANPQVANPNLIYPGDVLDIPETDASVRACEQEVVRLVNAERAKHGLAALTEDWELSRVARYKSQDMHDNRYFAHNSPTYGTPFRMIRAFGLSYRTAGENIAMGYAARLRAPSRPRPVHGLRRARRGRRGLDEQRGPPRQHPQQRLHEDRRRLRRRRTLLDAAVHRLRR